MNIPERDLIPLARSLEIIANEFSHLSGNLNMLLNKYNPAFKVDEDTMKSLLIDNHKQVSSSGFDPKSPGGNWYGKSDQ